MTTQLRPHVTGEQVLHPAPVHSTRLNWVRASNMFTAFVTDLGPRPFGRVFAAACDEGLTLISRHDGREIVFVIEHTEKPADDGVQWWDLVAVNPPSGFPGFTIRIYND